MLDDVTCQLGPPIWLWTISLPFDRRLNVINQVHEESLMQKISLLGRRDSWFKYHIDLTYLHNVRLITMLPFLKVDVHGRFARSNYLSGSPFAHGEFTHPSLFSIILSLVYLNPTYR